MWCKTKIKSNQKRYNFFSGIESYLIFNINEKLRLKNKK